MTFYGTHTYSNLVFITETLCNQITDHMNEE